MVDTEPYDEEITARIKRSKKMSKLRELKP